MHANHPHHAFWFATDVNRKGGETCQLVHTRSHPRQKPPIEKAIAAWESRRSPSRIGNPERKLLVLKKNFTTRTEDLGEWTQGHVRSEKSWWGDLTEAWASEAWASYDTRDALDGFVHHAFREFASGVEAGPSPQQASKKDCRPAEGGRVSGSKRVQASFHALSAPWKSALESTLEKSPGPFAAATSRFQPPSGCLRQMISEPSGHNPDTTPRRHPSPRTSKSSTAWQFAPSSETFPSFPRFNGKIDRWHTSQKNDSIHPGILFNNGPARRLAAHFGKYHNTERRHSVIGSIAPQDKPFGKEEAIFAVRHKTRQGQATTQIQTEKPSRSFNPSSSSSFQSTLKHNSLLELK